jgi:hypothetical protein
MVVVSEVMRQVSAVAARSIAEIGIRQATSTLASLAATSSIASTSLPTSAAGTATATDSQSTSTDTPGDNGTNDGGGNSSLLFFVALGFGVVFTNLWSVGWSRAPHLIVETLL